MRSTSLALCLFVVGGALAGWLLAGLVPPGLRQPHLHGKDFVLARSADQPIEVTEARWCFLPFLFADFDLQLEIELAERTEVDLLLRQVQPRLVDDALVPFTERFTSLRLSTVQDGAPWRHELDAVAGRRPGGVELAPGLVATVWVQGRGRMLRANVAGKWQPWCEADDEYGMVTLVARGGNAIVHGLRIQDRGQAGAWRWARWCWALLGGLGGLVVAGGAFAAGRRAPRLLAEAALFLVLTPVLAALLVRQFPHDLQWPRLGAMLGWLGLCLLPGCSWPRWWHRAVLLALVGAIGYGAAAARNDADAPSVALFGRRAGAQPSEALGQLVRGPRGLHDLRQPEPRVFLLGGQPLYDRGQAHDHLELRLATELQIALRRPVTVPCLPTADGSPMQQWRLFSTCYADGYRPQAIVFGVGDDIGLDGAPVTPTELAVVVAAAQQHTAERGSKLVLFADAGLPELLLSVLRAAERQGTPLVLARRDAAPAELGKALAAAIAPLLR
ncbi:MAG: hypothetical protein MUC36_20235 [Planctomycetes bacterium]|jgi:hypothetical protein|nr:hypothetical protein [Planctomycetota bacterium]